MEDKSDYQLKFMRVLAISILFSLRVLGQGANTEAMLGSDQALISEFEKFYKNNIRQETTDEWGEPYFYRIDQINGVHYFDYNLDDNQDAFVEFAVSPSDGGNVVYLFAALFKKEVRSYSFVTYVELKNAVFFKSFRNNTFSFQGYENRYSDKQVVIYYGLNKNGFYEIEDNKETLTTSVSSSVNESSKMRNVKASKASLGMSKRNKSINPVKREGLPPVAGYNLPQYDISDENKQDYGQSKYDTPVSLPSSAYEGLDDKKRKIFEDTVKNNRAYNEAAEKREIFKILIYSILIIFILFLAFLLLKYLIVEYQDRKFLKNIKKINFKSARYAGIKKDFESMPDSVLLLTYKNESKMSFEERFAFEEILVERKLIDQSPILEKLSSVTSNRFKV